MEGLDVGCGGGPASGSPLRWYFMLRAVDRFYEVHGRYPGTEAGEDSSAALVDTVALRDQLNSVLVTARVEAGEAALGGPESVLKMCTEMTRYGGAELHHVAALIGGVASQEAVKV